MGFVSLKSLARRSRRLWAEQLLSNQISTLDRALRSRFLQHCRCLWIAFANFHF